MTLGSDIAAALPEIRAHAESLMQDTCVITDPVGGAWDEETGSGSSGETPTPVYAGPCRVRMPSAGSGKADAGETAWPQADLVVSLPISGSSAVKVGDIVQITYRPHDAGSATDSYTVVGLHSQTYSTSRRLACRRDDRD